MTVDEEPEATAATKPSGPAAAAIVAAGIGALALGLMVTMAELGQSYADLLRFDQNYGLGTGVGPLSGKVIIAVVAFLASWAILGLMWRGREISVPKAFIATLVLVGLGFALTFPPVFVLFAPAE
jgi:hypothetical protein